MLGAGDTAHAAVPVMAQAFKLKEIRVTSRTPESRQSDAKEVTKEYSLNIRPVESAQEAPPRRGPRHLRHNDFYAVREGFLASAGNDLLLHRQASRDGKFSLQVR